ncbi:MAG: phenol hydroxylase subunit [Alphaproteobacteria bacterium]|nr:phenol hydroxylase subunit [Alphaproteobacteria bacterium]
MRAVENVGQEAPPGGSGGSGNAEAAAYVRILGVRLGRFVEFEYALDDGLLSVELILPFAAFQEFCRARNATVLAPTEEARASEVEQLAWREKQPGLLQRSTSRNG